MADPIGEATAAAGAALFPEGGQPEVENQPASAPAAATGAEPTPVEAAPAAPAEESFTDIDLSGLTPAQEATYRRMQADYTRKTQELSALRQPYLSAEEELKRRGVESINHAIAAVDIVSGLYSDPRSTFEQLFQAGLSREQILAHLGATVEQTPTEDYGDVPASTIESIRESVMAQVRQELAPAVQTYEQMTAEVRQQQWEAEAARQVSAVHKMYPSWGENQMNLAKQVADSRSDRSLIEAAKTVDAFVQRELADYLMSKQQQPAAAPVANGVASVEHQERTLHTLKDAAEATREHFRQLGYPV